MFWIVLVSTSTEINYRFDFDHYWTVDVKSTAVYSSRRSHLLHHDQLHVDRHHDLSCISFICNANCVDVFYVLSCFILPYCIAVVICWTWFLYKLKSQDFTEADVYRLVVQLVQIKQDTLAKTLDKYWQMQYKCNDLCHIMPYSQTSHLFAPALVSKSMPTTRSVKSPVNCIRTGWTMLHVEQLNDLFFLSSTAFCKWIQMFLVASHVVHDVSFVGWLSFQIGRLKKLAVFSEDLADDSFFRVDGKDKSWPSTQGGIRSWLMTVTFVDTLLQWNLNDVIYPSW